MRKQIKGVGEFDIGYATPWTCDNYGGLLTEFAMYKVLKDYDLTVLLIERPLSAPIKPNNRPQLFHICPYSEKEMQIALPHLKAMGKLNEKCKIFITASDQLFNNYLYNAFGRYITLDWVKDNKRKIAYAISFGFDFIFGPEYDRAEIQRCLNHFDAISVREKSGVRLLRNEFALEGKLVIDPVFMCPLSYYEELIENAQLDIPERPYYFAYILDPDKEKEFLIEQIKNKTGIDVIAVGDGELSADVIASKWNYKTYGRDNDICVEDWLKLIKHSEGVITDSYHGTCFSIIFQKQFISIANKVRGITRFESILETAKLGKKLVNFLDSDMAVNQLLEEIDYSNVIENLKAECTLSREWLENALFGENKIKGFSDYDAISTRVDWVEDDILNRFIPIHDKMGEIQEALGKITEKEQELEIVSKNASQRADDIEQMIKFLKEEYDLCLSMHEALYESKEKQMNESLLNMGREFDIIKQNQFYIDEETKTLKNIVEKQNEDILKVEKGVEEIKELLLMIDTAEEL